MFLDEKNVLEFCLILAWVKLNHLSRNRALNFNQIVRNEQAHK